MMTTIEKELREMTQVRRYLPNDTLEAYLEYASLYCKEAWLAFHEEYLRRMELQIVIQ